MHLSIVVNILMLLLLPLLSANVANAAITPTANSNNLHHQYHHQQQQISKAPLQLNPPPAITLDSRLLDRFDHRYPDGSYEFRYELTDGTARYERGYFALIDKVKTLIVVGYYSYRMPDGRYITVFYNADQFGYRQNQSITPQIYPNLPRSIEVPASTFNVSNANEEAAQPTRRPFAGAISTTRPAHF